MRPSEILKVSRQPHAMAMVLAFSVACERASGGISAPSAPVAAPIVNSAAGEASSVIDSAAGAAAAMGDSVQQVVAPAAAAVQPAVSSVTNVLQPAADRAPVSPDTVGTPDEETAGPDGAPPDEPAAPNPNDIVATPTAITTSSAVPNASTTSLRNMPSPWNVRRWVTSPDKGDVAYGR